MFSSLFRVSGEVFFFVAFSVILNICCADRASGFQDTPAEESETVVVEGVGIDQSSALKDAFRNAVRQVVGVMLDTETIVKNDELIEDRILMFSDGFIESGYQELGSKKEKDLIRVRIKVSVKKNKLAESLRRTNVKSLVVDIKKLFAESSSVLEAQGSAAKMLEKHLEEFQASVFDAEVDASPLISRVNDSQVEVVWKVRMKPNRENWKRWVERAEPLFKGLAVKSTQAKIRLAPIDTKVYARSLTANMFRYRYVEQSEIDSFLVRNEGFFENQELGLHQFDVDTDPHTWSPPDGLTFVWLNLSKNTSLKSSEWKMFQIKGGIPYYGCRLIFELVGAEDETLQKRELNFSRYQEGQIFGIPGVCTNPHERKGEVWISPGFMPDDDTYLSEMLLPVIFQMTPDELAEVKEVRVRIQSVPEERK